MRDVAIFRFSPTEGPGHFADWLDARGIGWQLIPLDQGAAIPADARAFSGVGMMGGPMSVYDDLPWIEPLCALVRDTVAAGVPVIGHCLGGQMLAKALAADVRRTPAPEIGWIDVEVADSGAAQSWFAGREKFETFQWHYDAFALPAGATRVLTNRYNPNQAYVVDDRHIGFQCHVEMTHELVDTWLRTGGDELPATSTPALQTAADIRRDLDTHVASLNAVASDIYTRWAQKLVR
jgi:GMP synthase-like glutamine amidotransferase